MTGDASHWFVRKVKMTFFALGGVKNHEGNAVMRPRIIPFLVLCVMAHTVGYAQADNPRERLDYWQNNFEELTVEEDPRAGKAHDIFNRLLRVAGQRPGVVPRLFIAKSESSNIPLAFAIPDGGVVITRKILNICYMEESIGDDRLAYVLAHEIAHQLKDDFWHMKFFQAVELSRDDEKDDNELLEEIREIAGETDKVLAKELQADEHGIVYASMAGFDTNAIITADDSVNFFEFFYRALDPTNVKGVPKDSTHPTPGQRAQTVKARLRQVVEKAELFELGLLFYQAGRPEEAALFFGEFLRFFPGREVYHNLAASHHLIALKHYRKWKGEDKGLFFRLSLTVATETRASKIQLRGGASGSDNPDERLFKEHLEKSVAHYKMAISQDPAFILSYNNLGSALLLLDEPYKAIGTFKDALKINPENAEVMNNLGVAYYLAENPSKAEQTLNKALKLDPSFNLVLFNLGKVAFDEDDRESAERYWAAYLKTDSSSRWAIYARESLSIEEHYKPAAKPDVTEAENIFGIEAGSWEDEIPNDWSSDQLVKKFSVQEEAHLMIQYGNGLLTVWQDDELLIALTPENYEGQSAGGISLGSTENDLHDRYGPPIRSIDMSQWASWIYPSQEVAFQVRGGKVISWMIYLED